MNRAELVSIIKELTVKADDQTALKAIEFYPMWKVGENLKVGQRVQYYGNLYTVKTAHITQADWVPDVETASLFELIDIKHTGTIEDPIPYDTNLTVFKDLYYVYDEILYICIRDSEQPLYATPDTLIDNYFGVVTND